MRNSIIAKLGIWKVYFQNTKLNSWRNDQHAWLRTQLKPLGGWRALPTRDRLPPHIILYNIINISWQRAAPVNTMNNTSNVWHYNSDLTMNIDTVKSNWLKSLINWLKLALNHEAIVVHRTHAHIFKCQHKGMWQIACANLLLLSKKGWRGGIELTVTTWNVVIWVTTLCGLAESYQHFGPILSVDAIWSMCTKDSAKYSAWGRIISG